MGTFARGLSLLLLGAAAIGCIANSMTSKRSGGVNTVEVGKMAPNITGVDADRQSFSLSDSRGKVVLLDFWAEF